MNQTRLPDKLPPLHFVTQLWGLSYVSLYADYVLPSLMCEGNLPALSGCEDAVYEIHTTEADWAVLSEHPNYLQAVEELGNWIKFRFVPIAAKIDDSYAVMSDCHRRAITAAEERKAAILFLQPDVIVGDGTLRTVRNALLSGKRLVMSPGLRTVREDMEEILRCHDDEQMGHCIPVRDLVAHAVANLHPISKSLLWRNGRINSYCSHLYWRVGDSSLYARCAHMHPLMVFPRQPGCGFDHTIDWDYFYRACPDTGDWFIATSSDDVCLVELSGRTKFEGTENWRLATPETVANFLVTAAEKPHLELLAAPYLFVGSTLEFVDWAKQNREGEGVVCKALTHRLTVVASTGTSVQVRSPYVGELVSLLVRARLYLAKRTSGNKAMRIIVYFPYLFLYLSLRSFWRIGNCLKTCTTKEVRHILWLLMRKTNGKY